MIFSILLSLEGDVKMTSVKYDDEFYTAVWKRVLSRYSIDAPILDLGDLSRQEYVLFFLRSFLINCSATHIRILDFGAGNWLYLGTILSEIKHFSETHNSVKTYEIIGIDYCEQAIEFGIKKYANIVPENVTIGKRVGDIHDIASTYPDNSCQLIISLETIEHLYDDASFFHAMTRILSNEGSIIISVPNRTPYLFSKNWFIYSFAKKIFSGKDKRVGHLRRYSVSEIVCLAGQARLRVSGVKCYGFLCSDYLKMLVDKCSCSFQLCKRIVLLENNLNNRLRIRHSEGFFVCLKKNDYI